MLNGNGFAKKERAQAIRLAVIREGQIFGVEDIANNRNYTTSVMCTSSTGTCYMIKADEFLFRIGKDDRTWKMIINRLKNKDAMTIQKIKKTVNTIV